MAGNGDAVALEAERQVVEATERYREVTASMEAGGRPEAGQRASVKAVGRALQLVAFVLRRAAAAGVTVERLTELTRWEPEIIRQALERQRAKLRPAGAARGARSGRRGPPGPARVAPAARAPPAVARAAASFGAEQRLRALLD